MIIELFGPPCAGKTTFACALAASLRAHGYPVDLVLSQRPAERLSQETPASDAHPRHTLPMIRRLTRPFAEVLTMARHPLTISQDVRTALDLIRIMPPSDILWLLRLIQYLTRLSRSQFQTADAGRIVLFDQAFVQAVCSLAVLCPAADELLISQALDKIPQSDLIVRLTAPTEVVSARLRDRERNATRMERLLELDLATSLKSLVIVGSLHEMLRTKGRFVTDVASLDQHSLHQSVERVERQIAMQYNVERRAAPSRNQADYDLFYADRSLKTPRQPLVGGS